MRLTIGFAEKSVVTVQPYLRAGHLVAGHTRVLPREAWISPENDVYKVYEKPTSEYNHFGTARKLGIVDLSDDGYARPLSEGWIRKADSNSYEIHERDLDRVVDLARVDGAEEAYIDVTSTNPKAPSKHLTYCVKHRRVKHVTIAGQVTSPGCRLCAAGKSTVQVQAHMRDGHPVRAHVRALPWQMTRAEFQKQNPHAWSPGWKLDQRAGQFDALGDDDVVWVFHGTDDATANAMLERGIRIADKPRVLARERYEAGEEARFAPGAGLGDGLYVGSDPHNVDGYGRRVLAIAVPKRAIRLSPEQATLGTRSVGEAIALSDAMVVADVPADAIVDVSTGRSGRPAHEELVAAAVRRGEHVPPEVRSEYHEVSKAVVVRPHVRDGKPVQGYVRGIEHAGRAARWRYESEQDPEKLASDQDFYHVTTLRNGYQIMRDGDVGGAAGPQTMAGGFYADYSRGKFFVTNRSGVAFWRDRIEEHLEQQYDKPPKLMVLRIPRELVEGRIADDQVGQRDHPASWVVLPRSEAEKAVVTKPQLPFAKPTGAQRKPVQHPGARGSTDWYLDKNGQVMYGQRPSAERPTRWDDQPGDPGQFAERFHREAATVASPEDREGLKFEEVYARHADFEHHAFLDAATKIDEEAGLQGESELALGDTEEWGTEPSLVTTYQDIPDYETLRYVAAKRGLYSKSPQKAVIAWERDEGAGQDHLYSVTVKAHASDLPKALDKAGLPYRTLVEHEDGSTTVHCFHVASMGSQDDIERALVIFADGYGGPDVERQAGRAEFIGSDDREEAGKIYRQIIADYEKSHRGGTQGAPEGDGGRRATGSDAPARKGFALVVGLRKSLSSFWHRVTGTGGSERKPVQNPGSRGATRWYRADNSGDVRYGEKPQPHAPASEMAASTPRPSVEAPHVTPPRVTAAPRLTVAAAETTPTPRATEPAPPAARRAHSSPSPTRDVKGAVGGSTPKQAHRERRQAALDAVDLPPLKLTDNPTEDDAKLATVALLKAGVLRQNTRGKLKGRVTLDVKAANDLRYTPTNDDTERTLRAALEGLRTYGVDPWKPNSNEIRKEFGKAYHEGGNVDGPLRTGLRGDMKLGAMMAGLIERVNNGETDLLSAAASDEKVTREDLAAREARLSALRTQEPELIAAKGQTKLADGHHEDHGTWKPPDFIHVAGKAGNAPRPWQSGACAWAEKAKRGIVGLDMGMGKTGFSIMDFAGRKQRGEADQALVFSEVNQIGGWEEEYKKWWPGCKVVVLNGDNLNAQLAKIEHEKPDAVIASYGLLSTGNDKALKRLTGGKKTAWYFDEARALRNTNTTTYKVAKGFLDKQDEAVAAFPLTGTPTPNNPTEAHALLELLHPGLMGPAAAFKQQHEQTVTVGGKRVKTYTNLNRLAERIEPWSYTKSRYDPDSRKILPDLVHVPAKLTMGKAQAAEYEKAAAGVLDVVKNIEDPEKPTASEKGKALAALTRMRQAAYDPATYDPHYTGGSAVVDDTIRRIDQSLREEPDRGVVCFAEHVSNFDTIKQRMMKELGLHDDEVGVITGEVSATERTKIRKALNAGKIKVLLSGYGSGGQGQNLQERSRRVITMQDPWTWARKDQAIARVYRQGQQEPTEHVNMTVPGTISDKMEETLSRKKGLGEALWNSKESDELVHTALDFDDYLKLAGIDKKQLNEARIAAGKKAAR